MHGRTPRDAPHRTPLHRRPLAPSRSRCQRPDDVPGRRPRADRRLSRFIHLDRHRTSASPVRPGQPPFDLVLAPDRRHDLDQPRTWTRVAIHQRTRFLRKSSHQQSARTLTTVPLRVTHDYSCCNGRCNTSERPTPVRIPLPPVSNPEVSNSLNLPPPRPARS
jgi:hypothetical protein